MTYNIQDGGGARAPLIAEVIASAASDVVLLNEADDERVVESLAKQLDYQYVWARGSGDKHIALLTCLPLVEWHIYNRRPITQAVLAVVVRATAKPLPDKAPPGQPVALPEQSLLVQLFCVHLVPYFMLLPHEFARWRTVRAMLRLIASKACGAHLILGDFNAVMRGERATTSVFPPRIQNQLRLQFGRQAHFALAPIVRAGYTDCFRRCHPGEQGFTWMPSCPSARLDFIFADPTIMPHLRRCELYAGPPADVASDHYPLVADFAI